MNFNRRNMDYRILYMHTWSFICVRLHTWGVGGTPTASQHNIFDSQKLSQIFLVLLTQAGFEPPVFGYRVRRSTNWATPSQPCHRPLVHAYCMSPNTQEKPHVPYRFSSSRTGMFTFINIDVLSKALTLHLVDRGPSDKKQKSLKTRFFKTYN